MSSTPSLQCGHCGQIRGHQAGNDAHCGKCKNLSCTTEWSMKRCREQEEQLAYDEYIKTSQQYSQGEASE